MRKIFKIRVLGADQVAISVVRAKQLESADKNSQASGVAERHLCMLTTIW